MLNKCKIGGIEVQILPLPPLEWVKVNKKLPGFVYGLVQKNVVGDVEETDIEEFYNEVKSWLRVCAKENGMAISDSRLETLSVPEAASAATVVSSINGFDEQLRAFFFGILQPRDAGFNQQPQLPSATPDARRELGNIIGIGH
jgi:hypothetical protein